MKIELRGLCKSYDGRRVLDRVSFEVAPGQIVGVLGENGAGKTTLLRCRVQAHQIKLRDVSAVLLFLGPASACMLGAMIDPNWVMTGVWLAGCAASVMVLMWFYGKAWGRGWLDLIHNKRTDS